MTIPNQSDTRLLVVSPARYGTNIVLENVLPKIASRADFDCTYLTSPLNDEMPGSCSTEYLLSDHLLRRLEPYRGPFFVYANLEFWRRAHSTIKQRADEYDLVWLHDPRLLRFAPQLFSQKLIITYHTELYSSKWSDHDGALSAYYRLSGIMERAGLSRFASATYTAVGSDIVDDIEALESQIEAHHVSNGVDTDHFHPGADPNQAVAVQNVDRTLLFVGRFAESKRPLFLLRLFESLQEASSQTLGLIMAGDGPLYDDARELVSERGIRNVSLPGFVPPDELPGVYAAADCFVSLTKYDPGGPLVLYEAAVSGLACAISDIPTARFVERQDCGSVLPLEDSSRAVGALLDLLEQDLHEKGERAREYAVENLSWSQRASEYVNVFARATDAVEPGGLEANEKSERQAK